MDYNRADIESAVRRMLATATSQADATSKLRQLLDLLPRGVFYGQDHTVRFLDDDGGDGSRSVHVRLTNGQDDMHPMIIIVWVPASDIVAPTTDPESE